MSGITARATLKASLGGGTLAAALGGKMVVNDYIIEMSEIEGGHRLTVSRGNDVQTMDVMNGSLTEADKAQIVEDVLAALPAAEGVKY